MLCSKGHRGWVPRLPSWVAMTTSALLNAREWDKNLSPSSIFSLQLLLRES
jgi:hypothetical protein